MILFPRLWWSSRSPYCVLLWAIMRGAPPRLCSCTGQISVRSIYQVKATWRFHTRPRVHTGHIHRSQNRQRPPRTRPRSPPWDSGFSIAKRAVSEQGPEARGLGNVVGERTMAPFKWCTWASLSRNMFSRRRSAAATGLGPHQPLAFCLVSISAFATQSRP
jgi:hypothetical protein